MRRITHLTPATPIPGSVRRRPATSRTGAARVPAAGAGARNSRLQQGQSQTPGLTCSGGSGFHNADTTARETASGFDVSGYERNSIPVIAEGDASPEGARWNEERVSLFQAEEYMPRPNDPAVKDPRCHGVKVRGDSMEPLLKPGMRVIVSPNLAIEDGGIAYVQLASNERLLQVVHKHADGYTLASYNPNYPPRFVERSEVRSIHRVAYVRLLK